ncbi:MAG TPA: hypothetical protein VGK32_03345 [Vicinamibacterales bacterium]
MTFTQNVGRKCGRRILAFRMACDLVRGHGLPGVSGGEETITIEVDNGRPQDELASPPGEKLAEPLHRRIQKP